MAKVLVLYYSMYGHIETMANAVAEGARSVSGAEVTVKRVPETMSEDIFKNAGGKANQAADVEAQLSWPTTTRFCLACPPALAICPARCVPS